MRMFITIGLISVIACRTDKSITIQNPAPKADIVSHNDGDVVLEGIPTLFIGGVTDANHTPDQLTTIWYVNGDIICDEVIPNENGETTCELTLGLGDTEITLAVRDAENARSEDTIVVSIEPTEAPEVQIVTPIASGVYYSDQKITFEGIVSDAEDASETLTAYWESDIDGVLSNVDTEPESSGTVIGYEYLTEGEHAIELHVEDSTGKTDRETVIINVGPPNSAPLCEILTPLDGAAGAEGGVVSFTGTTSDADVASDWLSVVWSSDKDGELGSTAPDSYGNIVFSYAGLSVNTHTIRLQVTDEIGATCTALRTFTVGTPPSVTINSPVNGDVWSDGTPIPFSATVTDAQDQASDVALEWVVNGNVISTQGATSTGEALFTYGALSYGTHNLVVTATDSDGLTDSDQVNFTINGVPTAPVISINPSTPTTSDGLNVSIDSPSVDPEGVTPTYTYEWQLGGQTQSAYMSSSLPSSATTKGEQWTVLVTPNDGIVDGTAGTASVVIGNSSPTISTVSISPTGTVYNDDVLTCLGIASDPDETPIVSYEWSIGGSVVGTSSTLDVSSTGSMPGTTVVCTATATDGDGATDSNSASVSLGNRNPSISASISTNGTNQNAELTCIGTATDPDGDTPTVTYEWFNGSNSLGSSNPLLLNSTIVSSGDVVDCIATATDAMGGTDTVTVSHTVTNTAPVINSVTVTPNPATLGQDDLTCTVSASDADGDSLLYSYQWSDSNGVQQTTTLVADTSDVFLASGTTEDTWTCEVTPYDGTDYGAPVNDSVTVEDGCPVEGDGSTVDCPSIDCAMILEDGYGNGDGIYWIDPEMDGGAYEVYCLMDTAYDGGGWTMISTHSDDGQDTWTWNNRNYFDTDTTTFGSLNALNEDFKSPALHDVGMQDLLFVHAPSGIWAGYNDVDDGSIDFGTLVDGIGGPICYSNGEGFSLSAGNLSVTGNLCSTELFINLQDRDGGACGFGNGSHSYGPAWSAHQNSGCFDDPGAVSGLGPFISNPTVENEPGTYSSFSNQSRGYGYGWAILGNTGTTGSAQNYMQVFVRRDYTDADGDGFAAWEDCDDNNASFGYTCPDGTSASQASISCKAILDDGYSTGDGNYWIDPDGLGAFEAYCDMTSDGGGWTVVGKIYAGDYTHLSDQEYINLIANPVYDVNINALTNPDVTTYNNMAFLNRSKMNALYDGSSSAILRIEMVENGYSSNNEGMYYQQFVNKPVGIDFWHVIRNSELWGSSGTSVVSNSVMVNGLGQDFLVGYGTGGYDSTLNSVVQNTYGVQYSPNTIGAWDFGVLQLINGESLTVSRHFGLICDAMSDGWQWVLTSNPNDSRWKNESFIHRTVIYFK